MLGRITQLNSWLVQASLLILSHQYKKNPEGKERTNNVIFVEEPSTGSHTSTRITAYDGLETRKVTTTEYTITGEDGYRTAETL